MKYLESILLISFILVTVQQRKQQKNQKQTISVFIPTLEERSRELVAALIHDYNIQACICVY